MRLASPTVGSTRRWLVLGAVLAFVVSLLTPMIDDAAEAVPDDEPLVSEEPSIYELRLPSSEVFHHLHEDLGLDIDNPATGPEGTVEVQAILTPGELEVARGQGAQVLRESEPPPLEALQEQFHGNVEVEPEQPTPRSRGRGRGVGGEDGPVVEAGSLQVLRADWFENYSGLFLYFEVRSAGGAAENLVIVDEPSSAAGTYAATGASFGPTLTDASLAGDIVLVDDGSSAPTEGCDPLIDFPAGAIALVDRGSCTFVQKVGNAQDAGAVAVIVANNVAGDPINLGGSDPSITIPSGMISLDDGDAIKAGLPASGSFQGNAVVADFEVDGVEHSEPLSPFVDAGQYMYHRFGSPRPIDGVPDTVTITSGDGSSVEVTPTEWLSGDVEPLPDDYEWGFVNEGYMDAVQTTERIESLAAEFPDLAELIDLPHDTHGYRRQAQAFLGNLTSNAFYVLTDAYGHEGGNDYVLEVVNPGTPNADLETELDGTTVWVSVATDGDGDTTSTAADVVAALNDDPDVSAIATAYTYRGNAGGSTVLTGTEEFSDGLDAPAHVPREPFDMKAIRLGSDRGGDQPGVLIYCQEHAREWVTPLVCLETVERLLRNYGSDPATTELMDGLDIFVIPTVNPDGTNYSMYDYNFQRRNMNNYCPPSESDMLRWNSFGVDLNRNFRIGSLFDGYSGASSSCTSDVFAGGSEASEPEAANELWLVDTFDNIRFSMNTHSHGGYFMWAPGAYQVPGRIPLPRPSVGVEDYFWEASEHILTRIKEYRGTVVHSGRTGPVIDVLYSAAGNSADDHYYFDEESRDPEIFAWNFEVGAQVWTGSFWSSPGFQPDFETEGFHQAMEFTVGMMGLLEVARDFAADDEGPTSTVNVDNGGWYSGPVDVVFETDEPATIYYTVDGSRPDWDSPTIERRDVRDIAEPLRIDSTTTLRWFAVDVAGNVEGGYDPDGRGHNYERVHIRIVDGDSPGRGGPPRGNGGPPGHRG